MSGQAGLHDRHEPLAAVRAPSLRDLVPDAAYAAHALHGAQAVWAEKNCYVDIWIEVLQALHLEPRAAMGFTLAIDFEGDQWTFFKPPHDELFALYGLEVHELNVWRPLLDHALEHLPADRLLSTEADAFWLPDTAGTDYRSKHTKTTIVLAEVDPAARRAVYFHNGGCFSLAGDDFEGVFRTRQPREPGELPLFAETIRLGRLARRPQAVLAREARALVAKHLARRPQDNPVKRFAARWSADLAGLQAAGLEHYHAWAFATLRQLGAAMELAAATLRFIAEQGDDDLASPIASLDLIANGAKTLILKGARSVMANKPLASEALLAEMAAAWEAAMSQLDRWAACPRPVAAAAV
jgi:hypothetical protein